MNNKANDNRKDLLKNWLRYHKWVLLSGGFFLLIFIGIIGSVSGLWSVQPDYCVAYVGSRRLTDEMYRAIESAFLSAGEDVNGDREIVIQIRQYVLPENETEDKDMITAQLTADINSCESFFFILEEPESFQFSFGVLRFTDGTLPALDDYSVSGKTIPLSDSPVFSQVLKDLSDPASSFMKNLSIGTRGFWTEKTSRYAKESDVLWEKIVL